jgi:cysteine sulfinate desulfinase/cysteine desulfurase-like protein
MLPFFSGKYSNPSSMHSSGRDAMAVIVTSRKEIAELSVYTSKANCIARNLLDEKKDADSAPSLFH